MINKFLFGIFGLAITQAAFSQGNTLADYKPGFYLGAQAGYARISEGSGPEDYINQFSGTKEISKGNFGGRFFIGYSFFPYFSLESGYAYYPRNFYKVSCQNIKIGSMTTIDLVAKGILPLERFSPQLVGWNLFGKLGVAMGAGGDKGSTVDKTFLKFRPTYGLGVGYNFTDHFGVDLSWLGIYSSDRLSAKDINFSSSKIHIGIPMTNIIAFGGYYKF